MRENTNRPMKIILATGGTGGHIFPAIETAQVLKENGHEVFFIGSLGAAEEKIKQKGFRTANLNAKGFNCASPKSVFDFVFYLGKSLKEAGRLLKEIEPAVICGFGSYASFAVVSVGKLRGKKTMIHEQNVLPGKANRVLANFVDKVAVSFNESRKFFQPVKTVLTGCPCHTKRPSLSRGEILRRFSLEENRKTLLILGGSQGSHRINMAILEVLEVLKKRFPLQVIHLSGQSDYAELQDRYKALDIPHSLFAFFEDMEMAYSIADCVVARAGAATVSEILAFGVPAVLIPYPYAGGHQRENAAVLVNLNLADMIEEKDLTSAKLAEAVIQALDKGKNWESINPLSASTKEAAENLAHEIIALSKN